MAVDYTMFKTPFFDIEIGDPSWQRRVKLPHHILKLVSKVEIVENMMVDDHLEPSQIIITFVEGSREPASTDYKLGNSGLYNIADTENSTDSDISNSLTNRAGVITDLIFSGNSGVRFLKDAEKVSGKVDNKIKRTVDGNDSTVDYTDTKTSPTFLFQQRNLVKVTWGYVNDVNIGNSAQQLLRSKMLSIINIASNFPESGMPTTTITCTSTTVILNQIASKVAIPFEKKSIVKKDGHNVEVNEDLPLKQVLEDVAQKAGMKVVISDNLLNSTIDKHAVKRILVGETPHQFFMRLARASGCYYEIMPDPKTGQDVFYFISKLDMHSKAIIVDKDLLNWKGQGSILKSYSISADFSALIGNQQKSLTPEGDMQSEDVKISDRVLVNADSPETNRKQEYTSASPVKNNANRTAENFDKNIFGGKTTGTVNYSPAQSKQRLQDTAQTRNDEQSRLVQINFTTIGYPKLLPGIMEISGIGVRYSGKYRIINVTHTLDNTGYTTTCSGLSSFLGSGGVKVPGIKSQQEQDSLQDERLLEKYIKYNGG